MSPLRGLLLGMACALLVAGIPCTVTAEESTGSVWPTFVVKIEDLRPLTAFELRTPGLVTKGRVTGPAILQVHVSAEGTVARAALLESCGNSDLDEASIRAMRLMRFKPYTFGEAPIDVTLVVPVHVPARLGRSPH